ncbi:MAG: Cationic amino acid transporter 2 [Candelina mexicana]|nr:MAG: Cationic amino acid transporter 2 [Candelina mexicana]
MRHNYTNEDGDYPEDKRAGSVDVENISQEAEDRRRDINRLTRGESLDRTLRRHQITGIAISGTIGTGFFINCGDFIGLSGSVGVILSYLFAGLIVTAVMLCLSEMVSVRPVPGAIFEYPKLYVDPALGFAVGFTYWLAYCMSCATLTVSTAVLTRYWQFPIDIGWVIVIVLIGVASSNIFGVAIYGNIEWVVKWFKLILVLGLDILMISINLGAGPKGEYIGGRYFSSEYRFTPGFSDTHIDDPHQKVDIQGGGGVLLALWTTTTLAQHAFIGVELPVVTAGEAKYPRRDLPKASRRIYLISNLVYVVSALIVAFNVPFTNPNLSPLHGAANDSITGHRSPFVIAIVNAGITHLPGFVNAVFIFAAWTAANTALYVASRTLFSLSKNSDIRYVRETIGRTSSGGTPLVAIGVSFLFAFLAFFGAQQGDVQKPLGVFSRIATTSILCVYGCECLAFLRFRAGMAHVRTIDRNDPKYTKTYYKSPRQPFPAYFGLIACFLLVLFNGWDTFFRISRRTISGSDAAVELLAAYLGPVLFVVFYILYKFVNGTQITGYPQFRNAYTPMETGLDREPPESANKIRRFLSWIK